MSLIRYMRMLFGTPSVTLGTTAAAGTAGTAVRTDATIAAFDATAPTTSAVADAAAVGSVAFAARRDHRHGREAFATNAIALGATATAGVATTHIRSDDTIAAFDATAPTTSAVADAAAVGTAAFAARRDHRHGREGFGAAGYPVDVQGTEADGTAALLARSDHQHALGILTTKGDVISYSTLPVRLAVGTNTQVLTADSTTATGLAWSAAGSKEIALRPGEAHFPDTAFADLARVVGTNIPYLIIQFDDTTIEEAYWVFAVPSNYSGNVTATIYWKGAATTNAVRWGVSLRSVGNDGTWDSTWTETAANDTAAGVAEALNTAAITVTAPFTASQMGQMRLRRVANDAGDTFVGDAKLVGVVLSW